MLLRKCVLVVLAAAMTAAPVSAAIEEIKIPPSRQHGLDMLLVDEDAMPQEPELAEGLRGIHVESWSSVPIDLLVPMHHLYTDLRRKLDGYRDRWGQLPQVRVGSQGGMMSIGSSDPRVPVLRHRLGLARQGGFDAALKASLTGYQQAHGLRSDGKAGRETIESLNRGAAHYERVILINMERARRLPAAVSTGKYLVVDAGSARLWMYENGHPVDSMKVVVGSPESETPMMAGLMRFSSVNPYWNVPSDLAAKLIAPRVLAEGISYLTDRGYQVLNGWAEDAVVLDPTGIDWGAVASGALELRVRQLPGGGNSMGVGSPGTELEFAL